MHLHLAEGVIWLALICNSKFCTALRSESEKERKKDKPRAGEKSEGWGPMDEKVKAKLSLI